MQTKWQSFLESNMNTFSGFLISWALTYYVVPLLWSIPITGSQSFGITVLFTVVSITRNYFVRRFFNSL